MERTLPWLLIGLVVYLLYVLGVRLPLRDAGAILLALIVAGEIWRRRKGASHAHPHDPE